MHFQEVSSISPSCPGHEVGRWVCSGLQAKEPSTFQHLPTGAKRQALLHKVGLSLRSLCSVGRTGLSLSARTSSSGPTAAPLDTKLGSPVSSRHPCQAVTSAARGLTARLDAADGHPEPMDEQQDRRGAAGAQGDDTPTPGASWPPRSDRTNAGRAPIPHGSLSPAEPRPGALHRAFRAGTSPRCRCTLSGAQLCIAHGWG